MGSDCECGNIKAQDLRIECQLPLLTVARNNSAISGGVRKTGNIEVHCEAGAVVAVLKVDFRSDTRGCLRGPVVRED